jgi:ParB-like chromosome segregation protein Spo0J
MKHNGITLAPARKFRKPAPVPENGRLKTIAQGTAEVFKLDPRIIRRQPGFNPRYDFGEVQILAEDILENGVLEALKVRKEGSSIFLVNGDRRLTAIEMLIRNELWPADPANPGLPMPVPCTSEGKGVQPVDRLFMMLSLNTGKPFTLLEKGLAYQQILAECPDINASEIARRSGDTKQAVSNALQLVNHGSPTLIAHVKADDLSATTALEIIKSHKDHAAQDAYLQDLLAIAKANGRSHATPKDLPSKQAKPTPETAPDPQHPATPDPQPFIADLSEDEPGDDDDDSSSPISNPKSQIPPSTPDPSAFERLKNAPSSNRDGTAGGPGEGYASPDKRLKLIESLLDQLYEDECHRGRWETVELVLDYLNGNHTIATIRKHLIK